MSIVTLKRKTQAQHNNMSAGQNAFSLNGTRRSSGYIGQDMLGRSLIRSLSRNGALKGHGGCCGKYPISEIKTSPEMSCLNKPNVVKSSSLNTNGLLMSRHRWIRRPQPFTSVKPDSIRNNNTQSSYIEHISRKAINDGENCHVVSDTVIKTCPSKCQSISKPSNFTGAVDANEHIQTLTKKCTNNEDFKIVKTNKGAPFICG